MPSPGRAFADGLGSRARVARGPGRGHGGRGLNMQDQEAAGKGRHAGGALRAAQLGHNEPPSAIGLADGAETGGIGSGLLRPRLRGRARRADVFVGRLRTGSPRGRFSGPTPRRRPARRPPCSWPAACCHPLAPNEERSDFRAS